MSTRQWRNPLESFLQALPSPAKKRGEQWQAKCPAHPDESPSLSIREARDGRVLLHCFAGCHYREIVAAVGLESRDLAPADRGVYDYGNGTRKRHKRTWEVFEGGGWKKSQGDVSKIPPTLYRLEEVQAAPLKEIILVVEGEKDVETARRQGFTATTSGNADSWRAEFAEHFRGRHVVIIPDNDAPGRKYRDAVAADVAPLAASFRVLELPDLPEKCDVTDWLNSGRTADELRQLIEQAPEFDSSLLLKAKREKGNQPAAVGWQLQSIGEIYSEPEPAITWLWDGVLPMGGSSLFVGRPKSGKSTAARDLTARIVRGDGEWLGRKLLSGPAVYLALQDRKGNVCDQLRRLGVPADAPLFLHHGRPPKGAIEDILQPILEMYRPVLLVLDTLAPILNAADLADYAETDRLIATITDLARNFGTHIMATHHSTKGGAQSDDETSVLGSTALSGGVDTMLLLKRSNGLRTLASIQREGEDLESVAVRLDKETGRLELAGTVEAIVLDHAIEAVIRKVDATPMLESDLCRAVGGNNVTTRKAIRAAFDRGLLQREGTGKKGSPFRYSIPNARFFATGSEKETIQ